MATGLYSTSAVAVVNGEHVDGDNLKQVSAAKQGRPVLQQCPELLQNAAGNSRKGLHAVQLKHMARYEKQH